MKKYKIIMYKPQNETCLTLNINAQNPAQAKYLALNFWSDMGFKVIKIEDMGIVKISKITAINGEEKKCGSCQRILKFSQFYTSHSAADGRQSKCITCQLEDQRIARAYLRKKRSEKNA